MNVASIRKLFKFTPETVSIERQTVNNNNKNEISNATLDCPKCLLKFPVASALAVHIQKNHEQLLVIPGGLQQNSENVDPHPQCDLCKKSFKNAKAHKTHKCCKVKGKPDPDKRYDCNICGKSYKNAKVRKAHKYSVHGKGSTGTFPCEICGKSFASSNIRSSHKYATHGKGKAVKKRCLICSKEFSDFTSAKIHEASHTPGAGKVTCPTCGKLIHKNRMTKHLHSHSQPVTCEMCGTVVANIFSLRNHIRKVHDRIRGSERRPVKCAICGKIVTRATLNVHMLLHDDEKRYQCQICGTKFSQPAGLRSHLPIHGVMDPLPYIRKRECQVCKQVLSCPTALINHKKTVHGIGALMCAYCERKFKCKRQLLGHIMTHLVE